MANEAPAPEFTGSVTIPDGPVAGGLYSVGAWPPAMTDRMIINALMAKLGNAVTLTPGDVKASRARSALQFDASTQGLIISLLHDQ